MRNLRFRRAARTSVLGTAALIAALSLTACQSGEPAPAAFDAEAAAAQAPASDTGKETAEDTGTAGTAGSGADTAKDSGSTTAKPASKQQKQQKQVSDACTDTNTELAITSVPRPVNHMLLTVTNTGSTACNAYYYPTLRFGEAQSVPPVIEESQPQAVVTLSPGQSAYAGIVTSSADGSGTDGYSTTDLEVGFQNVDAGSAGGTVSVPLGEEVYVDSTLAVTYWQTEMDDALMY
ncbi:DUF4232 domain-containing protein [Streptomyces sp. NPDC005794]|uniref:DUF4232 domain-containing protein n=1 Tax=Streptomyces sp. NPDC005794 TaxID=3364733 RepID=UPI0036CC8305